METEHEEFDEQVVAATGILGDGLIDALAIICASVARQIGKEPEVLADLQVALKVLRKKKNLQSSDAIAQQALNEVSRLLKGRIDHAARTRQ